MCCTSTPVATATTTTTTATTITTTIGEGIATGTVAQRLTSRPLATSMQPGTSMESRVVRLLAQQGVRLCVAVEWAALRRIPTCTGMAEVARDAICGGWWRCVDVGTRTKTHFAYATLV